MNENLERILKATSFVKSKINDFTPEVGIVLGSGLGSLANEITDALVIPYSEIPGFPESTAIGHKGNLILGKLANINVIAMQGRFHHYEGYKMELVTLPIRIMKLLGIKALFVSNAAGGVNFDFKIGDLMIITDHINLLPNPLIGKNLEDFGPRFPDMTRPYDLNLIKKAERIGKELNINLKKGVYIACTGPCYETPAEYNYFRLIGADAVGMSTTPEVIVARHSNIPVFGVSVITDEAHSNPEDYITDENAIVAAADAAAGRMTLLFKEMIKIC